MGFAALPSCVGGGVAQSAAGKPCTGPVARAVSTRLRSNRSASLRTFRKDNSFASVDGEMHPNMIMFGDIESELTDAGLCGARDAIDGSDKISNLAIEVHGPRSTVGNSR